MKYLLVMKGFYIKKTEVERETNHRRAGIASVLPVHPERKIRSQQAFCR